jgi:bifunctional non-homologous end joining protein LigD
MAATNPLSTYNAKRDFSITPEPAGKVAKRGKSLSFVIQKHAARSLHYDFRLELDGSLKSWAVPKGPSLDPAHKRMAVHVEDHPLSYGNFEGVIPPKQYGAGTVIVWDRGTWVPLEDPQAGYRNGKLKFELHGVKLHGRWALVRMRRREKERQEAWLLMKENDAEAHPEMDIVETVPDSVLQPAAKTEPAKQKPKRVSKPAAPKADKTPLPVRVTHADRVIDTESGVTKGDLVRFYASVAPLMLEHLRARPVALVRAPAGVGGQLFFQKHADSDELPGVQLQDPSLDPGHGPLLVINRAEGLLSSAQMNVVEFHTWNATTRSINKPDRMLFDLDPGDGVAWAQMQEAARLMRSFLAELGLVSFLKTSGGKGLHVVVPLSARTEWKVVKAFSQAIVQHMAEVVPDRFVAKSGPKNRVGKIFIDYLRNGFGSTTVAAWSARARPSLGVSVPVTWDELDMLKGSAHWTVKNIAQRLSTGNMPWAEYASTRQSLGAAMKKLGFRAPAADT